MHNACTGVYQMARSRPRMNFWSHNKKKIAQWNNEIVIFNPLEALFGKD